jgi:hypothetical protein
MVYQRPLSYLPNKHKALSWIHYWQLSLHFHWRALLLLPTSSIWVGLCWLIISWHGMSFIDGPSVATSMWVAHSSLIYSWVISGLFDVSHLVMALLFTAYHWPLQYEPSSKYSFIRGQSLASSMMSNWSKALLFTANQWPLQYEPPSNGSFIHGLSLASSMWAAHCGSSIHRSSLAPMVWAAHCWFIYSRPIDCFICVNIPLLVRLFTANQSLVSLMWAAERWIFHSRPITGLWCEMPIGGSFIRGLSQACLIWAAPCWLIIYGQSIPSLIDVSCRRMALLFTVDNQPHWCEMPIGGSFIRGLSLDSSMWAARNG